MVHKGFLALTWIIEIIGFEKYVFKSVHFVSIQLYFYFHNTFCFVSWKHYFRKTLSVFVTIKNASAINLEVVCKRGQGNTVICT